MKTFIKNINVLDCLFFVLLIAGLFFLRGFSAPTAAAPSSGDAMIRYTVEIYKREDGFENNVKVGEKLYDVEKGYEIGVITDVYALPYLEDSPDFEKGVFVRSPVIGLSHIYVVAESAAQISESATNIGQYQIAVGKEAFIKSRSFAAGGYTVIIERLN